MPETPSNNGIADNIQILNDKQRVFNICHKWTRDYVKSSSSKGKFKVDFIQLFMSDCGGTRKPNVVKTNHQPVSRLLLNHTNDPEKSRVLLLEST